MIGPGVYVHFAFCKSKCPYCDFNSRPGTRSELIAYLDALLAEIERTPSLDAVTVYFGGGTPTVFAPRELARVLHAVTARFVIAPGAEITLEANPGTVDEASLRALREAGFNRLSLGVQSLRDAELALLGRAHDASQARQAVASARAAGFDNLSLDLIRGLPGQKLEHWQETLEAAIALEPDHISAYGLSLEDGAPLKEKVERGELPRPRGSGSARWVDWTVRRLKRAGYRRYEISNYARPGRNPGTISTTGATASTPASAQARGVTGPEYAVATWLTRVSTPGWRWAARNSCARRRSLAASGHWARRSCWACA